MEFSFSISTSNEYSGLISVRIYCFDFLVVQGTLKSLPPHHSSKVSIFWHSAFFMVQLSHPYMTIGKTIDHWIIEKEREFQKNIYFCFIDNAKAFDCGDHNKLWKTLNEMGIPDCLICFLRKLYAGQETTVGTRHGTTDWFQIGKGVCQGHILSLCLFNLHAEYIM